MKTLGYTITSQLQRPRRVAVMRVTTEFLVALCKNGNRNYSVSNGLPDDAQIVAVSYDPIMAAWEIGVYSETFAEVPPELMPPTLDPVLWTQHYEPPIEETA